MNLLRTTRHIKWRALLALLFVFSTPAFAQTKVPKSAAKKIDNEQRTARAFEAARSNPLELRAFLVAMPKGADLHNHL